ncbi:trans-sulfuration enzyme family protein [Brevibacillus borstelensis]|uniref:trans-sulfuration enzyme family protein n=1 Tax=Brevibacillus borstelensis TaxID=45462 RepID=UPI0030BE2563
MADRFETKTVLIGHEPLRQVTGKASPIYQTSVFAFSSLEDVERYYAGEGEFLYTRNGNPNQHELADAVSRLEEAEAGVCAASGMGATMAGLLAVLGPGDHVLASHEIYGGTYSLLFNELTKLGISAECIDLSRLDSLDEHIRSNTKLFFMETITNPLLTVADMPYWIQQAKNYGLTVMVDNTFATPYLVQPTLFGADLVVHSATKYIGGHSDVTAGVLVGTKGLIERARQVVVNYGASLSPFEAWLTARGLKTLALRMERQCENASTVAQFLKGHPAVKQTFYPDAEHTSFFFRQKQGAMVSFTLADESRVYDFYRSLSWIKLAPSLAGVETSVSHPVTTSHRALSEEQRAATGITMGLVRLSVGIEAAEDIMEELDRALLA